MATYYATGRLGFQHAIEIDDSVLMHRKETAVEVIFRAQDAVNKYNKIGARPEVSAQVKKVSSLADALEEARLKKNDYSDADRMYAFGDKRQRAAVTRADSGNLRANLANREAIDRQIKDLQSKLTKAIEELEKVGSINPRSV